ncbi:MAG: sugar-binding protein [Deltaproteobacteria bacterium]|nr:sugar-binding protein [Deltaproteobacteria bacterium]
MIVRALRWAPITAALLGLALPPAAAAAPNEVGICAHDGRVPFLDAAVDMGLGWVRLDGNWFFHEPADDQYRWGYLEDAVRAAHQRGLKVFITLAYTPEWVPRRPSAEAGSHNDVPVGDAEWRDFVTDAVTHFRALGVTHFGMWNEPNLDGFFDGDADEYVSLILLPGAEALRAACADCKVLGPDLANVGDCDDFLDRVLTLTPPGTFDILTHHIYNGFQEMGKQIWDGDRFHEALEQQRFSWTRRGLRQVLDAHGYTGEVWITETGYRATPGDAGEESRQKQHLDLVFDYQLARDWWTNTFIYESSDCGPDQPGCTIDGYGLMRATAGQPGSRSYPGDFRLKPALGGVGDYVATHPAIGLPDPVCLDGIDNDGDGLTDGMDLGCTGPGDADELGDPPPRVVEVYRSAGHILDGDLGDLGAGGELALGAGDWQGSGAPGAADLSATLRVRWLPDRLVFGLEVEDDRHVNERSPDTLWAGDSLQLAFDLGGNGGVGYDGVDDHELTFALGGAGPLGHRGTGPSQATDAWELAIERRGTRTIYEIALLESALPGLPLAAGAEVAFSFLINEDDGAGREGWLELGPGIGDGKVPGYFGRLRLLGEVRGGGGATDGGTPDGGGTPDAGGTPDGGGAPDGGALSDGGGTPDGGWAWPDGGETPVDAGDGSTTPPRTGCDSGSSSGSAGALWALVLTGLLAIRRRAY